MSELSVRETAARALGRSAESMGIRAVGGMETDIFTDAVLAAVADHDGLAPLLRAHTYHDWAQDCRCRIAGDDAMDGDDWAAHLADVVRAWLRDPS